MTTLPRNQLSMTGPMEEQSHPDTPRLPVLLVDDNVDCCTLMAKLLRAMGYQFDVAYDGRSALRLIDQRKYGIAILDYEMPGMNGVDLFRRIRRARPDLAAVFVTGFTGIDVVYPAVEAGILRVFSKPVDFQQLLPVVEEQIGTAA